MTNYLLLLVAVLPPIAFIIFIYWMDRHEPESLKNIMLAILLGVFSIIPSLIVQLGFGWIPLFSLPGLSGSFFESFLLVAPSEEFFKFLVIYIFIRKKPFFDEINDGIVYFGAGAIGFALLENILYVFDHGFGVGFMRAFTSIPLHTFCGVLIGYHVGLSRFSQTTKPRWLIFRGIVLAILTHALYNTLASSNNLLLLVFVLFVLMVYFVGFFLLRHGRRLSMQNSVTPIINFRVEDVAIDVEGKSYLSTKKETWKAVLGRLLLFATVFFWGLVFMGGRSDPAELMELIFGTIILTFIPFLIGVLLEVSYQRRKRKRIYLSAKTDPTC